MSGPVRHQMALDAALAEQCAAGLFQAGLRVYTMSPPAVTIGRNQKWETVIDERIIEAREWDWSRRVTGGGALLHYRELNYAVVLSKSILAEYGLSSFRQAFELIMRGLVQSLRTLGCRPVLNLGLRGAGAISNTSPAHGLCERSLTRFEIEVEGTKAVAAAQLMTSGACLQHGTLYFESPTIADAFWPSQDSSLDATTHWWHLLDKLPQGGSPPKVLEGVIIDGFSTALDLEFDYQELDQRILESSANVRLRWENEGYDRRR